MADGLENTHFPRLEDRLLVIYDGHCGFCNRSIRWFLVRDRRDRLRFAPSESPMVAALLNRHGISTLAPNTILVVESAVESAGSPQERVFSRSDAVIALLRQLGRPWLFVGALLKLIPGPIRNLGYTVVARLRYRIAGRFETCPLPTAEERRHFL
jgi:predicted DCC family thiol-disulfide oxidoreductase YuxK